MNVLGLRNEQSRQRDVLHAAKPAQGYQLEYLVLVRNIRRHVCVNEPGRNRIDSDLGRPHFLGQWLGEPNDARLGRTVGALAHIAVQTHHAGDVDDAAALSLAHHGLSDMLAHAHRAQEIGVDDVLQVLVFELDQ